MALAAVLAGLYLDTNFINRGPFYIRYDPEVQYMLSSLSVFKGYPYVYIDHPGTPVEVLGSLLLALTYVPVKLVAGSFVMFHLTHPWLFLSLAHAVLTVANIVAFVLLARCAVPIESWSDVGASLAIAGLPYAVHPLAFPSLALWSHNSMCLSAGSLLLLALLLALRSERAPQPTHCRALAFGAGVLTAVQLYFVSWIIGIVVAVLTLGVLQKRQRQQLLRTGLGMGMLFGAGFVIATLPILPRYPAFAGWVIHLAFHQGRYGGGATGITSWLQLSTNFLQLTGELPELFVAVLAIISLVILGLVRQGSRRDGLTAVAVGLLVQLALTIAMILKHPGAKYMLAVAALLPVLLAVALELLRSSGARLQFLSAALGGAVLVGFVHQLVRVVIKQTELVSSLEKSKRDREQYLVAYAASRGLDRSTLKLLWTYGVYDRCYALWLGDEYAGGAFNPEVSQLCPNDGTYNVWARGTQLPDRGWTPLANAPEWKIIVTPADFLNIFPYLKDFGQVVCPDAGGTPGRCDKGDGGGYAKERVAFIHRRVDVPLTDGS